MDTSGRVLGKIQWKNKAFEINGIVISTNLIKSKKGTSISFNFKQNWKRYWQWGPSSPRFSIKYGDHQWMATDCSNNSTQAIFTTKFRSRIFRRPKLATFTTQKPLPQTEALFFILAMLRMEIKRLEAEDSGV
ncbi:hypothetical protein K443DRAFT_681534 [Laccaria amethystina LaAM-08-1]|uniref:Uncharacterized protein n=1 Tax=Laccaria amethystina LaAM-08-1 TaxID=1095629 RepID=A0A0C9XMV9_9AGAR|nr:hypothetical protein K443DRAFT_681534 [Laccaria amethystina LaAM-08-1]